MKQNLRQILIIIVFSLACAATLFSQNKCRDYQIFDGSEDIVSYGMDTTSNWWIITSPFKNQYRIHINGKYGKYYSNVKGPFFSPNGEDWAYFGQNNTNWELVYGDTAIHYKPLLAASNAGDIVFSQNGEFLAYSYFVNESEILNTDSVKYETQRKVGKFYVNNYGNQFAFVQQRGDGVILKTNTWESDYFDQIMPMGFWYDNKFMYFAKNGNYWALYRNKEKLTENYFNIREAVINISGNVLAFIGRFANDNESAIIFSDEYSEPLKGKEYNTCSGLILHPYLPIIAYKASWQLINKVVYGNTELAAGVDISDLYFSWDGSELFYIACEVDCQAFLNGKRMNAGGSLFADMDIAFKPQNNTIAYSTANSMIVRDLTNKQLTAGLMVDEIIIPRYNRFADRYETLGRIYNRIYLMTCRF